jgi:ABC-type antimicrobial peptide transport system permease subunit
VRAALPTRTRVDGRSWVDGYESFLAAREFVGGIFATLGLASLILATAGLFGVLAYVVNQRMREFAVRVALGASRRNVVRLVLHDSLVMALGGTAAGAFAAFFFGGLFAGRWLWGMPSIDAIALVTAEAILLIVTFTASLLPALRAARANPVDVLRAI